MTDEMEPLTLKDLLLSFLETVEDLVIENAKLRTIVSRCLREQNSSSSVDDLILETPLNEDIATDLRLLYDQARQQIQKRSDPELALTKLLELFPKSGRPY